MRLDLLFVAKSSLTVLISAASIALSVVSANADAANDLEKFVSKLPRGTLGIPAQWLEMETLLGWEKMMLIFGYADNQTVCQAMLVLAKKDSPDRNFLCLPAN